MAVFANAGVMLKMPPTTAAIITTPAAISDALTIRVDVFAVDLIPKVGTIYKI
jgi:hypothetical protein